jgi:dolichol-phosphate mannosyltransferase
LIITIIIPTYNESGNLPLLVEALFELPLKTLNVLVVDDQSTDGTGEIAESLKSTFPNRMDVIHRSGKLGLGSAYITAMLQVLRGESQVIGQMDADFSHDPGKIPALVEALFASDIAVGSRYIPGGAVDRAWPFWRKWLSAFGNAYARTILCLPIRDTTGGFRLWRREVLEAMPLERVRSNGYVFLVEMAYLAHRLGFSFKEVPIYFAERQRGQSKMCLSIQLEAALRVWSLLWQYKDIKPINTIPSNNKPRLD